MDFLAWLGRFHPVIVHLPIGILLIGVVFHFLDQRSSNNNLTRATKTIYFFGFISAAIAALAGWFLAREGGYEADVIFWHRWVGIAMVLLSFGLWRWYQDPQKNHSLVTWGGLALLLGLTYTGHLGGVLTHGEDYLVEQAPTFIKSMVGYEEGVKKTIYNDPDSTYVYRDLIEPFLKEKCWTCHDDNLHKGGLVMTSPEALMEGGRNGEIIDATAQDSEIFKRVVMNPSSKKYMPPKGTPLSYGEIKLLEWWIDEGAPFDSAVTRMEATPEIERILMQRHELDTKPKTFLEKTQVDAASEDDLNEVAAQGFYIRPIAMTTNFLDVKWKNVDTLSLENSLPVLRKVAKQIAWLDLGHAEVTDEMLDVVSEFENLLRLRLQDNPITDTGVKKLTDLKHLESLNLYKTKITDISAADLSQLKSLRKLYVWQTEFTAEAADRLQEENKNLEVVLGHQITASGD